MLRYLRAHYEPDWRFASRQFLYVCLLDLQAIKPGNVGLHGEGHGKTCRDYRQSASAAAELISRPDWKIGRCILRAARATYDVVGCNTNMGVLLLSAPLIAAYYREPASPRTTCVPPESLHRRVEHELSELDVEDARDVYKALRLMRPAGLGQVKDADIEQPPVIGLREAMALAAQRDSIAAQYQNGFVTVFERALPTWIELSQRWQDTRWAMSGVFLHLLAHFPDSHIARIHGQDTASSVSDKIKPLSEKFCDADAPQVFRQRLLELDASWKSAGISPGSTADLTLAGVLAARLDGWSDGSGMEVLPTGDDSH